MTSHISGCFIVHPYYLSLATCRICKVLRTWVSPAHWLAVGARRRCFLYLSF